MEGTGILWTFIGRGSSINSKNCNLNKKYIQTREDDLSSNAFFVLFKIPYNLLWFLHYLTSSSSLILLFWFSPCLQVSGDSSHLRIHLRSHLAEDRIIRSHDRVILWSVRGAHSTLSSLYILELILAEIEEQRRSLVWFQGKKDYFHHHPFLLIFLFDLDISYLVSCDAEHLIKIWWKPMGSVILTEFFLWRDSWSSHSPLMMIYHSDWEREAFVCDTKKEKKFLELKWDLAANDIRGVTNGDWQQVLRHRHDSIIHPYCCCSIDILWYGSSIWSIKITNDTHEDRTDHNKKLLLFLTFLFKITECSCNLLYSCWWRRDFYWCFDGEGGLLLLEGAKKCWIINRKELRTSSF